MRLRERLPLLPVLRLLLRPGGWPLPARQRVQEALRQPEPLPGRWQPLRAL